MIVIWMKWIDLIWEIIININLCGFDFYKRIRIVKKSLKKI